MTELSDLLTVFGEDGRDPQSSAVGALGWRFDSPLADGLGGGFPAPRGGLATLALAILLGALSGILMLPIFGETQFIYFQF